jgi:hypothetical protein
MSTAECTHPLDVIAWRRGFKAPASCPYCKKASM